jgi:N-acetylglucosaminyldiphosphoundecaprenol N-acetyl-beta-D-mannosaminyltransferase
MHGPTNELDSSVVDSGDAVMSEHVPPALQYLFGVPINPLTMEEVLSLADDAIVQQRRLLICVVNAAKLVYMRRDEELRKAVLAADLVLPDGMSVVWAAKLLGQRVPERVTGIDLMFRLFERGDERGYRVYCLGGTEEVMDLVRTRVEIDYPNVTIVGTHHGYYAEEDEPRIVADIVAAKPDILFVGMSMPKKELFLARWFDEFGVPVCHGVGGAFDILAGKVKRAPGPLQRFGMEWSYRLLQEPRRMWRRYLVTNVVFCFMLLAELVGRTKPLRP